MGTSLLDGFRVLMAPGLQNSGPAHWQSRWQRLYPGFERVEQDDWDAPDLAAWSRRVDELRAAGGDERPLLIVAHSFGCLATVSSLARSAEGIAGVMLVAPADPDKFGIAHLLPQHPLPRPSILIASSNDPWMHADAAASWARRWGSEFVAAGALGHINGESGLGDWPAGLMQLEALARAALYDHHPQRAAVPT
jgi:predicted alpha/beta hydrolase family esterase